MSTTDSNSSQVNPSNPAGSSQVQVVDLPSMDNYEPFLNRPDSRIPQQQIIQSAIQSRFLNPIQQWPQPQDNSNIQTTDLKFAFTTIGDGVGGNPGSVAALNFIFQNTSTQPVFVEWCGTMFIDGTAPINAYPEPGQTTGVIHPTDWHVESYKAAYFGTGLDNGFNVNQQNQDSQWFIVKFAGSGAHEITIQYYWRTVVNQAVSATPTTLGQ